MRLGKDVKAENIELVLDWASKRTLPIDILKATFNPEMQGIEYLTIDSRSTR